MSTCIAPWHRPGTDEPHDATNGLLCRRAYRDLEKQLAELPALDQWLHANLPAGGKGGDQDWITGNSRDAPIPIRPAVLDMHAEIVDLLNSWARLVAEERDLRGPWRPLRHDSRAERDRLQRGVEQTATVTELTAFLLAQLEWSSAQPWVDDFTSAVNLLTRQAHAVMPSRPGRHDLTMPCPNPDCEQRTLCRYDGDSSVHCRSCEERWPEADYARFAAVLDAQRKAC